MNFTEMTTQELNEKLTEARSQRPTAENWETLFAIEAELIKRGAMIGAFYSE